MWQYVVVKYEGAACLSSNSHHHRFIIIKYPVALLWGSLFTTQHIKLNVCNSFSSLTSLPPPPPYPYAGQCVAAQIQIWPAGIRQ